LAADRLDLLPGEQVLVDLKPHWSFLTAPLLVSLAVIAAGVALDVGIPHTSVALHWVEGSVVAVPCVWLVARVVRWRRSSLILTSVRLVEQWGVASRQQAETELSRIVSVTAVQSLVRRIIGTGRLELEILGEEEIRWLDDVRKPVILQRVINRRLRPFDQYPYEPHPFDR
jgi:uncharacterized membrane protein YdbT with pleckstrin-like domain